MRNYKLECIILKSRNLTEKDKVFLVFSREKGKISLKAKGTSNIKSKLRGHLIPLGLANIGVAKGKGDLDVITGAQNINPYLNIKSDLDKLSIAFWASEIINSLTIENENNERVFELLVSFLDHLDQVDLDDKKDLIMVAFLFKLLSIEGHSPKVESCVVCEKVYEEDKENYYFDLEHGGILCQNCEAHKSHSIKITLDQLKVLNALSKLDFTEAVRINLSKKLSKESKDLIQNFNRYIFHKEFKSEKFIEEIQKI